MLKIEKIEEVIGKEKEKEKENILVVISQIMTKKIKRTFVNAI